MAKKKKRRPVQNKQVRAKHIANKVPEKKKSVPRSPEITLDEFEQEIKKDLYQEKISVKPKQTTKEQTKSKANKVKPSNRQYLTNLPTSVRDLSEEEKILKNLYSEQREVSENKLAKRLVFTQKQKSKSNHIFTVLKVLFFLAIVVLISLVFIISPKIELNGDSKVVLSYNQEYQESGAKATYLGKDITKDMKISGQVDTSKVGTYEITYEVDRLIFHVKKKRKVQVVDQKKPVIELEGNSEVNVCPKGEYQEAGYHAYDEYDGDLTEKVNDSIRENSLENAVSNIEATTKNINDLTSSLNSVSDSVGGIIPKTSTTVDEINGITSNVNAITCGVRKTLRKKCGGLRLIFGQVIDECN